LFHERVPELEAKEMKKVKLLTALYVKSEILEAQLR